MSSLTRERQLKRLNGIKYWIDIRDFSKKMSWDSGREIYSRKFKISESVFSIDIYPNGNTSMSFLIYVPVEYRYTATISQYA